MASHVTFCNGTYERGPDGVWTYFWGGPVPGAGDLTLETALAQRLLADATALPEQLTREDVDWAVELSGISEPVVTVSDRRHTVVVGMTAPELNVIYMLTVAEVAELASVSKATIDSYRYRGYLPDPQVVKGRTPLWSRPVIRHWLESRPGSGWRTDVYGTRERTEPARSMPITSARRARRAARR